MKIKRKRIIWGIVLLILLPLFLFVALPYWLLPTIVDSIARSEMVKAGLVNPQIKTKQITIFSTIIQDISFESNGAKISCPSVEAYYSPVSLFHKEIKSISVAESAAELATLLPPEVKEKLHSSRVTFKFDLENNGSHYIGRLNGDLLGGDYSSDLSFDIKKGELVLDGNINPKLKDDTPTPSFTLNYVMSDCYSGEPKGTGELAVPDTNLKLGTNLTLTNNVVDITATLNSVVSKNDPYFEKLITKLDEQQLLKSFYTEVYSKLSVKLSTKTQLPAWDLILRFAELQTAIAMEDNKELAINKGTASIHISGLGERWVLNSIPIYVRNITFDEIELTNGRFKILADEKEFLLSEGSINAFGGTLSVYALYLNFNRLNAGFTIFIDDIKLSEVITALPNLEGTGTGTLHGKLPMSLYAGKKLKIHNAFLFSKPGEKGKLMLSDTKLLQNALSNSGVPEKTCSDLGVALANLDYNVIRFELVDGIDTNQSLQMQIEGTTTQNKNTVPVELNVRINGSFENLLNFGLKSQGLLKK